LDGSCSIVEGEALALIEALHAMEQRGLAHVIIETDSKSVGDAIRLIRGGSSEFSFLIKSV
jgi:ribonuclease HI